MGYAIIVGEKGILVRIVGKENMAIIIKILRKQKMPLTLMEMTWCWVC